MDAMRTYRWGLRFFALVSLCGLLALPFALRCCAAFSRWEFGRRASVAEVLLDWPMDFRVFLLTVVAALVCTAALLVMTFVARWESRARGSSRIWAIVLRVLLSSLMVGVLYVPAIYAVGLFAVPGGPHNLLWMLGIPMIVGWMSWPRRAGLAWGALLAVSGWICLAILSVALGIPLD